VHLREVAVEQDDLIVVAGGGLEGVLAVEDDVTAMPSRRSPTAIVAASSL
jgi:hypothetical protein